MNKKWKKGILSSLLITTVVAIPLMARPMMQKITAYIDSNMVYHLDGEKILENTNTLQYKGKNYVSVREIAEALGKEVTFEEGKVILTTPQDETVQQVTSNKTIQKAVIKDIEEDDRTITILPVGKDNRPENYMILNVEKDTQLRHETIKKVVTLDDLEEGMLVKVVHSPAVTKSLPPRTSAVEVMVLKENGDLTSDDYEDNFEDDFDYDTTYETDIEDAKIIEINHGQKYLVVQNNRGTYTVKFDHKTKVEFDDDDHKKANVNSLKVGQSIDIELEKGIAVEIEVH